MNAQIGVRAGRAVVRARGAGGVVGRRERARDQRLETVANPDARPRLAWSGDADGLERAPKAVRDIRSRVDERAVEVDGEQLDLAEAQNTRTAISAGAASKSSISLSSFSSVSDAPAISSEVQ